MFILSVDPDAIPNSAREPVETKNITDSEKDIFGFEIVWNVPEPSEFIDEYEVIITEQAKRKRRNEPLRFLVLSNENQFQFTNGTAFTKYIAGVDALLNVSSINGRVPALLPITLQTAQGSELALGQNGLHLRVLFMYHIPSTSSSLTFSLSPLYPSIITSRGRQGK